MEIRGTKTQFIAQAISEARMTAAHFRKLTRREAGQLKFNRRVLPLVAKKEGILLGSYGGSAELNSHYPDGPEGPWYPIPMPDRNGGMIRRGAASPCWNPNQP